MKTFDYDDPRPETNNASLGDEATDPEDETLNDSEMDDAVEEEDEPPEAYDADDAPEEGAARSLEHDREDLAAREGTKRRRRRERRPRDERADGAHGFLVRVLDEMGMDVSVRRRRPRPESSPDEINLEIVGRDVGRVIGKKGQVLAALQYLVNRVTNRPGSARRHVVLDAEGYRHRRETTLASMARRLGEQAVKEGKIITFEPMNPRDRRVVHLALAKLPNVVTKSDGEGDDRRVRIIPVHR